MKAPWCKYPDCKCSVNVALGQEPSVYQCPAQDKIPQVGLSKYEALQDQIDYLTKRVTELESQTNRDKNTIKPEDMDKQRILERLSRAALTEYPLSLHQYNYLALQQAKIRLSELNEHRGAMVFSQRIMENAIIDLDQVMQEIGNPFEQKP